MTILPGAIAGGQAIAERACDKFLLWCGTSGCVAHDEPELPAMVRPRELGPRMSAIQGAFETFPLCARDKEENFGKANQISRKDVAGEPISRILCAACPVR